MTAYILFEWDDDANVHIPTPEKVYFQPIPNTPFNEPVVKYGNYQEVIKVKGDLFVITELSCEGHTTIHGVTGVEHYDFNYDFGYSPIFSTQSVVEANWEEIIDPKYTEKTNLRKQIAELTERLNSL